MDDQRLSPSRQLYDKGMRFLVWLCAGLTCALLAFLIGYIFCRGVPGLTWELLSGQTSYIKNTIGILPNILNTLYIILVAMVIVLPLGVGAAIYLTEYAENKKLVSLIEFAAETLTGIPSIIFGLVGMLFFVQKMNLQAGILAGKVNNRFDPKGTATRAEVATVLRRFVEIVIDPQAANGWQQNDSGQWNYYRNGESVKGWLSEDQKWYWLDKVTGIMFAGDWKQIDGKWYYFYADGTMAVNTASDR